MMAHACEARTSTQAGHAKHYDSCELPVKHDHAHRVPCWKQSFVRHKAQSAPQSIREDAP